MVEAEPLDRKLLASGVTSARKINGHADDNVHVVKKCGDMLAPLCPKSLKEYMGLPRQQRRMIRRAVQSAFELKHLPDDQSSYGRFTNLVGELKNPLDPSAHKDRIGRFLHYFASRG